MKMFSLFLNILSCLLLLRNGTIDKSEKFEDTRGAIRSHKSRKDRQYNVQKKRGEIRDHNIQSTTRQSNTNPTKNSPRYLKNRKIGKSNNLQIFGSNTTKESKLDRQNQNMLRFKR